jgi:hypothetical protein
MRPFYLQNLDEYQEAPISEYDTGARCVGNLQFQTVDGRGWMCWVSYPQCSPSKAYFYQRGSAKEAYRTAWRVKRLLANAW